MIIKLTTKLVMCTTSVLGIGRSQTGVRLMVAQPGVLTMSSICSRTPMTGPSILGTRFKILGLE